MKSSEYLEKLAECTGIEIGEFFTINIEKQDNIPRANYSNLVLMLDEMGFIYSYNIKNLKRLIYGEKVRHDAVTSFAFFIGQIIGSNFKITTYKKIQGIKFGDKVIISNKDFIRTKMQSKYDRPCDISTRYAYCLAPSTSNVYVVEYIENGLEYGIETKYYYIRKNGTDNKTAPLYCVAEKGLRRIDQKEEICQTNV